MVDLISLMIKYLVITFLVAFSLTKAQILDSIITDLKVNSDTLAVALDSLSLSDSLIITVKPDSIAPLYSYPLSGKSNFLANQKLLKSDYKYTGDYLRIFPFNFIKDLGFTGQPNETFIYGVGNDAVSYLIDGVSYNDRYSNSLNLNLIQSEDIDSLEIVRLPRGFLYGSYNNPVSINFITKDFISVKPYSRIRFYQGTDRDMMLDGSFNTIISKRFSASFDITNRIFDGSYDNSDYSIWQGKFKLKYFLSNDVNIIASYNYNDYNAGYSGGVNIDSINSLGENVDNILYDFRAAPMLYPTGELKTLTHLPRLRFLIKPFEWIKTDASLFYLVRKYEKNTIASQYTENKTYGLNIRNSVNYDMFKFQLNVDYEKSKTLNSGSYYTNIDSVQLHNYQDELKFNLFSVAGIVSLNLLDNTIVPSVFFKTSSYNNELYDPSLESNFKDRNSSGYGADLLIKLKSNLGVYLGFSNIDPYRIDNPNYYQLETGVNLSDKVISAELKYFVNNYSKKFFIQDTTTKQYALGSVNGFGVNLIFNYWKLLLESNSSVYSTSKDQLIGVPAFQTKTGLYFKGILFNNNLDLKTGFVFYYTGKNNVYSYEHGVIEVPASNKLDFTLVGEIQKVAIVYFTWENLFDNNYYITPYYPMPARNLRFGVAWELFN